MNASTPVERIAQILQTAGYKRANVPLQIGGIKFEVAAAFVGSDTSQDLIVVADTAFEKEQRILRNVQAMARALDVAASTRPLTLVVAGPRPLASTMEALSKVCRVLPVGVTGGSDLEASLKNWLLVLMPLNIPKARQSVANPMVEISSQVSELSPAIASLVDHAQRGKAAVEGQFYAALELVLSEVENDDDP